MTRSLTKELLTPFKTRSTETSDGLAAIQAQLNNLRREIKQVNKKVYAAQVGCELCKGPHYTKDCTLKEEDFIILDMPEDVKVPLILGRPFLSTTHSKIDVFKRKITLRVRDEKIIFKSVKPASSLIKRVYMLSLRKRMELDLEAKIMGETLVLNISLDPLYGDYIELNDLNVPLVLRRDKVDDLMPTIKEAVEDMDHYLDEGIGEVDESVTYQMVWSILRFRRHTNEQCNKIPPLLKNLILFEIQRWKNGSHAGTKAFMRLNEGS
nr:hypothetical protein [Tanacetum cinerariifolium]